MQYRVRSNEKHKNDPSKSSSLRIHPTYYKALQQVHDKNLFAKGNFPKSVLVHILCQVCLLYPQGRVSKPGPMDLFKAFCFIRLPWTGMSFEVAHTFSCVSDPSLFVVIPILFSLVCFLGFSASLLAFLQPIASSLFQPTMSFCC